MKYTVISTFNASGYNQYGQRMIQTFLQNWPQDVELVIYTENCQVAESAPNLTVIDLEQASPELVAFKQKWRNIPKANGDVSADPVRNRRKDSGKGFKWNAVRFSHKVYAVFAEARRTHSDWLIWMDADMVCHSPISIDFLNRMCDPGRDVCYLGRVGKYTECGLYALNLNSDSTLEFLRVFQHYYDDAEQGIFTLMEWHDSFVFDHVRTLVPMNGLDWSGRLIAGEGHPLINSEWGAYLDHLKGNRKQLGRSKVEDLKVIRKEGYWQ